MTEDKKIEKMAKNVCHLDRTCDECMTSFECKAMTYAKRFYNAGYRKASDVAREIFEEIEKKISSMKYISNTKRKTVKVEEVKEQINWVLREVVPNTIAKIKKKYIGEDINVPTNTEDGE